MAETNTSNIGFEKQIWDAACVLRGNIDASEYKSVVLGLIFLKYISDRFEAKYQELVAEGDGFEEDKDEYTAENIFFVPENARWSVISAAAHTPEIGTVIDEAMRSIEKENKRLKDILPKNFARPELDKRRLGEVVDLFTNIQMIDHGNSKDILGRTYEYCLAKFAEQEGKLAGEFYTPSCVVRTLVEVLQPYNGRVYDPCCGSGGMFVQSSKFIENHGGNIKNISVYGQDSNPTTWKLAQMNLAIRGIEADLGKFSADTFFNDCHPQLKADFIMANPPFNLSGWGQDKLLDDVRWQYGTPPANNANFAWLQHMIWHLAPNGRIGMVLANGSLSSQSGGEGEIRKNIINADLVDCIVAMPSQLFYTTQIPVSLWFLARNKKQKGKTLFIDARKLGTMVTRKLRELTDEDIQRIADTYNAFVDGTLEDEKGFCAVVTTQDIAKQDYILTPGRYVGIEEQEDDGEPFDEKMSRLTSELSELFAKSHELEAEIREADLGKFSADTFFNDCHPQLKADFIMANPPFNLSGWGQDKLLDDVRWQYGTPPANNANFAWLQHMIWHLAPNGRIGMVLANGSLSSQSGGEGEIRKNIINADLVDCIVAMPSQLFYTTQIPVSLWFLARNKKQKGKTLFIDARKLGTMVTRKLRELTDEDIQRIADTYNAFVDGTLEDEKGFCAVVTTQDIAKQDYILTPGRYVGIEEQEDDGEPFDEKMSRLTSELSELFAKSHELEAEIRERLGAIGYEL